MEFLNDVWAFFQAGFDQINEVQGVIIALVAALILPAWRQLPAFVLGAAVVHVLVDIMLPVVANGAPLLFPDIVELRFWTYVAALLAGYLIAIAALMLVRKLLLKR
ncbi:MAG: hypothetical protein ACFE0P_15395 [Oceanicaulis sp.]